METLLRAALIAWLRADPALAGEANIVAEERPVQASLPWIGLTASSSTDWSTKTERGREVRLALQYHYRGDDPATAATTVAALEDRIAALPRTQAGWTVIGNRFLKARSEQRANNVRAVLLEYRFRILAA